MFPGGKITKYSTYTMVSKCHHRQTANEATGLYVSWWRKITKHFTCITVSKCHHRIGYRPGSLWLYPSGRGRPPTQLHSLSEYTVKKSFSIFPSPAGMPLTKLSLGGNNLYLTSLIPHRQSLISDIQAGDGNIEKIFYGVERVQYIVLIV
jgi:hypothetical protein